MSKTKYSYKYSRPEQDETVENATEFKSGWPNDGDEFHAQWIAEDAAQDDWDCRDGWEASWPQVFDIYTDSGVLIGRFSVERDYAPSFSARTVDVPE